MSYKPDEATIMSYLYGELEPAQQKQVDAYFESHPDELQKVQEMTDVLKMMGAVQDKEVIAPPVFEDAKTVSFWRSNAFKTVASIAASLLLILVAARLIGPDISYTSGELRISFGKPLQEKKQAEIPKAEAAGLTAVDVQNMINRSLDGNASAVDARLNATQQSLTASITRSLDVNSKKVDDLVRNTSQASQEQLRSYVAGLQTENLKTIKDYFQLTAKEQNDYVENLLIGFTKYMQEQRKQDLMLVQNKVNNLEKNSDQFKQETEQLLVSLISNTKKKSY